MFPGIHFFSMPDWHGRRFAICLLVGGLLIIPLGKITANEQEPAAAGRSVDNNVTDTAGQNGSRSPTLADPTIVSDEEIASLIEGLASDSYATRIRCRARLMRIGLAAFDQLREARNHPDNEVAIVARLLTSGLRVQWATPSDSPEARELLSEYGSHTVTERRKRIEGIARLSRDDAFSPLLRLARFETEPILARAAALALIGHAANAHLDHSNIPDQHTAATDRDALEATQIEKSLQQQDEISTHWLRQYADDLRQGKLDVAAWDKVIQRNREHLSLEGDAADSDSAVATSELLKLIRLTAERALLAGYPNDALKIVIDNVDLIPSRTQTLIETATWALDHSLYGAVIAMQQAHSEMYHKSPILLYSAAEANTFDGQTKDASALAEIALAINPLPEQLDAESNPAAPDDGGPVDPNKPAPLHPQTIEDHAKAHIDIADELTERGLFQWAEQEYQLVIDRLPVDTAMSSSARLKLASMLGELLRHGDVVETLQPLAQRINKDDEFRDRLIMRRFSYTVVQSNMDFHRGLLMIQQGDTEGAKPVLREAFNMYQENIDILIAMFRLDGDAKWKAEVATTLDEQIRLARSEIEDARNSIQRVGPFQMSDVELAQRLNAYAWLVSNTAGDMNEALRFSQESLRLTPAEPALMDTCARCYFAVGDLEAAVKMQAEACRLMPHSPPLQRQLREFRYALEQ